MTRKNTNIKTIQTLKHDTIKHDMSSRVPVLVNFRLWRLVTCQDYNWKCLEFRNCNFGHSRMGSHRRRHKITVWKSLVFVVMHLCMCRNWTPSSIVAILRFILNLFVEFWLFITQYSRITLKNSGELENRLTNEKCLNSSEFTLRTHVWLDQVCIAFSVRVSLGIWLGIQVHTELPYCNSGPSRTIRSKITVPVPVLQTHHYNFATGSVSWTRLSCLMWLLAYSVF